VIPQGVQVFIALEPVDMRGSFDRLSGLAQQTTGYDARSGAVFVFYSRRRGQASFSIPFVARSRSLPVASPSREASSPHADRWPRRQRGGPSRHAST